MDTFAPEYIFVQDNILFVAGKEMDTFWEPRLKEGQEMVSLDFPTLWELKINKDGIEKFELHIDMLKEEEVLTISFDIDDASFIKENKNIENLGILLHFNPETSYASNAIFISDIQTGLKKILENDH